MIPCKKFNKKYFDSINKQTYKVVFLAIDTNDDDENEEEEEGGDNKASSSDKDETKMEQ